MENLYFLGCGVTMLVTNESVARLEEYEKKLEELQKPQKSPLKLFKSR